MTAREYTEEAVWRQKETLKHQGTLIHRSLDWAGIQHAGLLIAMIASFVGLTWFLGIWALRFMVRMIGL